MTGPVRTRFRIWLLLLLASLAVIPLTAQRWKVDSDLLSLLPRDNRDPAVEAALERYGENLGRRALFLISAPDLPRAKRAAEAFAAALCANGAFAEARVQADATLLGGLADYLPFRYSLLGERQRQLLQNGHAGEIETEALRALYTPAGFLHPFSAAEDPLGLLAGFVADQKPPVGRARPVDGVLAVVDAHEVNVLVIAQTAGSALGGRQEALAATALESARNAAFKAGALDEVGSGLILHAAAAAQRAKFEMSLFSTLSLLGCLWLLIAVYRSWKPVVLSALAIGAGAIAGLQSCLWVFGEVHLVTLVFGSSLIGTAVDYAAFYFSDHFRPGSTDAAQRLRRVAPPILIGYATTALSYFALFAAPFPGLRQIALFAIVGLGVACGTMLCLFPGLGAISTASAVSAAPLLDRMRRLGSRPWRSWSPSARGIALAAGAIVMIGLLRVVFVDDVRALNRPTAELLRGEQRVREVLGQSADSRLFLVQAADEQTLLEREEALTARLAALRASGALGGYFAVSAAVPSQRQQAADHALMLRTVYAPGGLLATLMARLGYPAAAIDAALGAARADRPLLTPAAFFASAYAEPYRGEWLGKLDAAGQASIVALFDVHDDAALSTAAAGLPGIRLVDKLADISEVLRRYRRLALGLLAAAYLALGVALAAWRGRRYAMQLLTPAVLAATLAVAVQGWLSIPLNMFSVLALLLVMGMGVDYAVFLRQPVSASPAALLAVCVATIAAALSFGMLAFSSTPFIRSIGLTMSIGIFLAAGLAILLRPDEVGESLEIGSINQLNQESP